MTVLISHLAFIILLKLEFIAYISFVVLSITRQIRRLELIFKLIKYPFEPTIFLGGVIVDLSPLDHKSRIPTLASALLNMPQIAYVP